MSAATPRNRDFYLWDATLKGFGLKITPKGRKDFLVQYRAPDATSRTRRVTLGPYGELTVEQARSRARAVLAERTLGKDPAANKQERLRNEVLLRYAFDIFLKTHVEAKRTSKTAADYARIFRLHIEPIFGSSTVNALTHQQVGTFHRQTGDKPFQANRCVSLLSKFFKWYEAQGYRALNSNPCRHVSEYPEPARNRFLSASERDRPLAVLNEVENGAAQSVYVIAPIRLLILTGARLNEILNLQWAFIDWDQCLVRLPRSKTGPKVLHLSRPAIEVLSAIPKINENPFVICGQRYGQHLVNLQKPWRAIGKLADLEDVRIHDLRHSYAATAAASSLSLPMIGALLGHTQAQTSKRYAHLADDPLKEAADKVRRAIAGD